MTTIRFREIKLRGVRRWTENGKRKQETKVFMQTVNPFNKGVDGFIKTREQIMDELRAERSKWLADAFEARLAEINGAETGG
jgi:hypothetical protein